MIIAVDFDGTLCQDKYTKIGKPRKSLIKFIKLHKLSGDKLILWTCRSNERLKEAIEWCKEQGIEFDAINDNLKEHIDKYNNNSRKVYADLYIDDKSLKL